MGGQRGRCGVGGCFKRKKQPVTQQSGVHLLQAGTTVLWAGAQRGAGRPPGTHSPPGKHRRLQTRGSPSSWWHGGARSRAMRNAFTAGMPTGHLPAKSSLFPAPLESAPRESNLDLTLPYARLFLPLLSTQTSVPLAPHPTQREIASSSFPASRLLPPSLLGRRPCPAHGPPGHASTDRGCP